MIRRIDGHAPKGDRPPFGKVLRAASAEDMRAHQENARREAEATFLHRPHRGEGS